VVVVFSAELWIGQARIWQARIWQARNWQAGRLDSWTFVSLPVAASEEIRELAGGPGRAPPPRPGGPGCRAPTR
jgi:hypothetical protein